MRRVVIFANGLLPQPELARALLWPDDILLAADGGTRHALALGLRPSTIIGDLDSADADLDSLAASGVELIKYPADKDVTDLGLAVQHALKLKPRVLLIVGGLGGRLDQTIGNIALLSDRKNSKVNVSIDDGVEQVLFCRENVKVEGRAGDIVSLIPWGGDAKGVVTHGLRWALEDETLYAHQTRGISNEMLEDLADVSIRSGLLLVVHRRQMERKQ